MMGALGQKNSCGYMEVASFITYSAVVGAGVAIPRKDFKSDDSIAPANSGMTTIGIKISFGYLCQNFSDCRMEYYSARTHHMESLDSGFFQKSDRIANPILFHKVFCPEILR